MATLKRISLAALALGAAMLGTAGQTQARDLPPGTLKFEVLHAFTGPDGKGPIAQKLAIDPQGVVYGATDLGGANGFGTVWSLTPPAGRSKAWALATLYDYPSNPEQYLVENKGVVRARDGTIYAADRGGIVAIAPGTKAVTTVAAATLKVWDITSIDLAPQGTIYATTRHGGAAGIGSLLSVSPPAPAATAYEFGPIGPFGIKPTEPNWIVAGPGGVLTGTTEGTNGSPYDGKPGDGGGAAIFQRAPGQAGVTLLTTVPVSYGYLIGAVPDSKGNVYATTSDINGGSSFLKYSSAGGLEVMHTFAAADGGYPQAPPTLAADGNLYGTTTIHGPLGNPTACGTLYRVTPAGQFTTLHVFKGATGGCATSSNLVEDKAGWLYGTTEYTSISGDRLSGNGLVFRFHP